MEMPQNGGRSKRLPSDADAARPTVGAAIALNKDRFLDPARSIGLNHRSLLAA
jgi:hypothetical protein